MDFNEMKETVLKDQNDIFSQEDIEQNKGMGVLASFPALFWIPLVAKPDSQYGKFCANQGLILLIFVVVASIVSVILGKIFGLIPFIGGLLAGLIGGVLGLAQVGGWLLLFISALQGKVRSLPLIGNLFTVFK